LDSLVRFPDVPVDGRGRLTGEVVQPLIGAERAAAAAGLAVDRGLLLSSCAGVGCWWGDLDLLRAVGAVDIVGDHPALLRLARDEGWSMTPLDDAADVRGRTA
jgi:phosphoserine phosphatase